MHSELMAVLEDANREIERWVSNWPEISLELHNLPHRLQAISGTLALVAQRLDRVSLDRPQRPRFETAVGRYVSNLGRLRTALIGLQERLRVRRDQLKKDFQHLKSARSWAQTFRATNLN